MSSIQKLYNLMPGIDCSACFTPYCNSLARRIVLGLNDVDECPVATTGRARSERLQGLRDAISTGVRPAERDYVRVVNTGDVLPLQTAEGTRRLDLLDVQRASELLEGLIGVGHVGSATKIGILRATIDGRPMTISRDGRVLIGGKGPPEAPALDTLARVLWGSVNLRGPIIPRHGADGTGVCVRGMQGGPARRIRRREGAMS